MKPYKHKEFENISSSPMSFLKHKGTHTGENSSKIITVMRYFYISDMVNIMKELSLKKKKATSISNVRKFSFHSFQRHEECHSQ